MLPKNKSLQLWRTVLHSDIRFCFTLNTGHDFTLANVCDTFKEVGIGEPDWQEVSRNLKLGLYGQVSFTELYEAWCKCDPSWEKLSYALGKFTEYQQVAKQAKKKAGVCVMNALKVCK